MAFITGSSGNMSSRLPSNYDGRTKGHANDSTAEQPDVQRRQATSVSRRQRNVKALSMSVLEGASEPSHAGVDRDRRRNELTRSASRNKWTTTVDWKGPSKVTYGHNNISPGYQSKIVTSACGNGFASEGHAESKIDENSCKPVLRRWISSASQRKVERRNVKSVQCSTADVDLSEKSTDNLFVGSKCQSLKAGHENTQTIEIDFDSSRLATGSTTSDEFFRGTSTKDKTANRVISELDTTDVNGNLLTSDGSVSTQKERPNDRAAAVAGRRGRQHQPQQQQSEEGQQAKTICQNEEEALLSLVDATRHKELMGEKIPSLGSVPLLPRLGNDSLGLHSRDNDKYTVSSQESRTKSSSLVRRRLDQQSSSDISKELEQESVLQSATAKDTFPMKASHDKSSSANEAAGKSSSNDVGDYAKRLSAVRERIQRVRNGMRRASINSDTTTVPSRQQHRTEGTTLSKSTTIEKEHDQRSEASAADNRLDNRHNTELDGVSTANSGKTAVDETAIGHGSIARGRQRVTRPSRTVTESGEAAQDEQLEHRQRTSVGLRPKEPVDSRRESTYDDTNPSKLSERRSSGTLDGLHHKLTRLRNSFRRAHSKDKHNGSTTSSAEHQTDLLQAPMGPAQSQSLPSSRKTSQDGERVSEDRPRRKSLSSFARNRSPDSGNRDFVSRFRRSFRKSKLPDKTPVASCNEKEESSDSCDTANDVSKVALVPQSSVELQGPVLSRQEDEGTDSPALSLPSAEVKQCNSHKEESAGIAKKHTDEADMTNASVLSVSLEKLNIHATKKPVETAGQRIFSIAMPTAMTLNKPIAIVKGSQRSTASRCNDADKEPEVITSTATPSETQPTMTMKSAAASCTVSCGSGRSDLTKYRRSKSAPYGTHPGPVIDFITQKSFHSDNAHTDSLKRKALLMDDISTTDREMTQRMEPKTPPSTKTTITRKVSSVSVKLRRGSTICLGDTRLLASRVGLENKQEKKDDKPVALVAISRSISLVPNIKDACCIDESTPMQNSNMTLQEATNKPADETKSIVKVTSHYIESIDKHQYPCVDATTEGADNNTESSQTTSQRESAISSILPNISNSEDAADAVQASLASEGCTRADQNSNGNKQMESHLRASSCTEERENATLSPKARRKLHMRERRQKNAIALKAEDIPSVSRGGALNRGQKGPPTCDVSQDSLESSQGLVEGKPVTSDITRNKQATEEDHARGSIQCTPNQCDTSTTHGLVQSEASETSVVETKPTSVRGSVKERIKNRKFRKERIAHSKSLPSGIDENIFKQIAVPQADTEMVDSVSPGNTGVAKLLTNSEANQVSGRLQDGCTDAVKPRSKDDSVTYRRKNRRSMRERPKTLTNGIAPSLIATAVDSGDNMAGEENMSFADIKKKFLAGDASNTKGSASEKKTPKKTRSNRRYKTITEGIAPSVLEAARASVGGDHVVPGLVVSEALDHALTVSTDHVNRKSFIVDNDNKGGRRASLSASSDNIALFIKESDLQAANDGAQDGEGLPSVSSLKNRFLQAVEDTNNKHKSSVTRRNKRTAKKDRPHTICGIDDASMKQIELEIQLLNDDQGAETSKVTPGPSFAGHDDSLNYLFDDICRKEGMTMDDLSKHLDSNLDDLLESPILRRKTDNHRSELQASSSIQAGDDNETTNSDAHPDSELTATTSTDILIKELVPNSCQNVPLSSEDAPPEERSALFLKAAEDEEKQSSFEETKRESNDLDIVSSRSACLLSVDSSRRNVRPRRKARGSMNPVKALSSREDTYSEPTESSKEHATSKTNASSDASSYRGRSGLSERSRGQQLWRKVALANEAKQALMSSEDFSKVALKKVKTPGDSSANKSEHFAGHEISQVLIQVKGRKKVQSTIVDFSVSSMNGGDCYVAVIPKEIICWCGKQCNVIERAKATEIASRIQQKKEMGCKATSVVQLDQGNPSELRLFKSLGDGGDGKRKIQNAGDGTSDHDYEQTTISSYMVYGVNDDDTAQLVPLPELCARMPSKDMLATNKAFVFDFVSEVYVWFGRQTSSSLRKQMHSLAQQRFDEGYVSQARKSSTVQAAGARRISLSSEVAADKSATGSNRLHTHQHSQHGGQVVCKTRPDYAILVVLFEQAEWVIFREKFCDWPDESRIIRMKGAPESRGIVSKVVAPVDVKVVDPTTMVAPLGPPPAVVIEGTDLGRGRGKPKGFDGYHIVTKRLEMWHVTESRHWPIPQDSVGQFHSGEGYVVRWEYAVVPSRLIRSIDDLQTVHGRQRFCYFFWLGNDCSVNEQGATAVMTVELDKEKGPQVRVVQGKEPAHFLNLFGGGMIIHAGKRPLENIRPSFTDNSVIRLYCTRGEDAREGCLLQVPASVDSLRSRSSYVLLLCRQGEVFLWHGCKSQMATRTTALHCAKKLIEYHPDEASIGDASEIFLTEVEEGQEPEVFWIALGGQEDYGSLLRDTVNDWTISPRMYRLTSATGEMISQEIVSPSRLPDINCPFPVLQDDLYNVDQPAIFILDAVREVYLWLGWWPDDEETEASASMKTRWDLDRRKAMESAVLFAKAAGRSLSCLFVIDAGLEPDSFIDLFPYWVVQDDVTDIQLQDRVECDDLKLVVTELETFSKEFYSLDELKQRPPPQGVDPTKLETYLSDADFHAVFGIDRHTFTQQPSWKQANLKRRHGLY